MHSRLLLLFIALIVLFVPLNYTSADYSDTQKLTLQDFTQDYPNNLPALRYGTSVAIDGDWMVVGAPGNAIHTGMAYIYKRVSGAWTLRKTLVPDFPPTEGMAFGYAVAIDGTQIMVSAPNLQNRTGMVFVYERDTDGPEAWGEYSILGYDGIPEGSDFGASLDIQGTTAFVGAPTYGTNDAGAVFVYHIPDASLVRQINGTQPAGAFGQSVDADGNYLVIGAPRAPNISGNKSGVAYVHAKDTGGVDNWGLAYALNGSNANDQFGFAVGITDAGTSRRVVVGAPQYDNGVNVDAGAAYFFNDSVLNTAIIGDVNGANLAFSVAIDGAEALVGVPRASGSAGHVRAYTYSTTWTQNGTSVTQADAAADDSFGWSVDVNDTLAVAGAPNDREDETIAPPGAPLAGSVLALSKSGTWGAEAEYVGAADPIFGDNFTSFGHAIAMTDTWLAVGSPLEDLGRGAVYLYRNVGGVWTPHSRLASMWRQSDGMQFGFAVALHGSHLVVGAPSATGFPNGVGFAGAVYLFEFNGTAWEQQVERFSPNPTTNGGFGYSVDIFGDVVVIGSPIENDNGGRVYFTRDLNTLSGLADITATLPSTDTYWGTSVAAYDPAPGTPDDESIVIGTDDHDAVYVFSGATFNTITTLNRPAGGGANYGYGVDIYNGRVAVGDSSFTGTSHVYVFSGAGYRTVTTLTSPGSEAMGYFLELDDTRLLVGAADTNNNTGRAVVFKRSGETWAQDGVFDASDGQADDRLGQSVTMVNGVFAASALPTYGTQREGAVYLFETTPQVIVNPTALSVAEEGPTSDTFTVALDTVPSANVTIQLTFDANNIQVDSGSGFGASPQTVTLTPTNALNGVTVTVRAIDDAIDEADPHSIIISTSPTSSSDARFNGLSVSFIDVDVSDNDTAGITLTESGGTTEVTEGGASDTYTLVLNSRPTETVNVAFTFDPMQIILNGDTDGTYNTTFTTGNWDTSQTLTVTAVNDTLVEDNPHTTTIVHAVTSADANYNALSVSNMSVSIIDNDTITVVFANPLPSLAEQGTHNIPVRLDIVNNGLPGGTLSQSVTVSATRINDTAEDADSALTVAEVTFEAGATNGTTRNFVLSVTDDRVAERNETLSLELGLIAGQASLDGAALVTLTDNDPVVMNFATTSSNAPEATTPHTITVTLTINANGSVGTASIEEAVTLNFVAQPITATTPEDYNFSASPITFEAGIVSGANRSVAVAIVNDALVENNETFELAIDSITSALADVSFMSAPHIVTIISDDVPNLVFTNLNGTPLNRASDVNVREGGIINDAYRVALSSQPTDTVTVTLTFDNTELQLAANSGAYQGTPLTLTFDAANWATPQRIDVTALEDFALDAGALPITHDTASTGDSAYNALPNVDVTVNVQDGVTTAPNGFVLQAPIDRAFFVDVSTLTAFRWQDTATTSPGLTFDLTVTRTQPDEPDTVVLTFTNVTRGADADGLVCDGTQCSLTIGAIERALLTDGVYQWNVTAKNPFGNTAASAPFTFTVNTSGELLQNGSFETTAPNPINAARWRRVTMTSYDVRACNATIANSGTCAYRFRFPTNGVLLNQTRTLQQFINAPTFGTAGDTLTLSAFVRTNKLSGVARLRVEVTYATGSPQVINIRIPTGTNAYTQLSRALVLTGQPTSIRVYISGLKSRGAFIVDDVSLKLTPSAAPFVPTPPTDSDGLVPLPLPPAPVAPPIEGETLPTPVTDND